MYKLAAWLGGLVTSFVVYLMKSFTFNAAVRIMLITVTIAGTVALFATLMAFKQALITTITNPYVLQGFTAILPWNFELCLSIYASANAVAWAYSFNRNLLWDSVNVHRQSSFMKG